MRVWTIIFLLAISGGTRAHADARSQADQHYRHGVALLERGDPAGALVEFDAAIGLLRHPKILVARASALTDLDRLLDAATAYEVALAEPGLKPALATFARDRLAALDARLTRLTVEVDAPSATVSIDGGPRVPAPVTRRLLPGVHAIDVSAPGRDPVHDRVTTRAEQRTLSIRTRPSGQSEPARVRVPTPDRVAAGARAPRTPAPAAPATTPPGRRAPRRSLLGRWYFWAGVGSVIVGGTVLAVAMTRDPGVTHVHGDADLGEALVTFP